MAKATYVRGQSDLSDAFLRCRTVNHSWDDFYPIDMESPHFGWRLSLRCTRCTTERHDVINLRGEVMSREYRYPDGYRMPANETPDRAHLRSMMFTRIRSRLNAGALSTEMSQRNGKKAKPAVAETRS